ncbi:MAG: cyanophycinase [Clostridia bacterium]|nr:cyanophycinase [Clostridia bacterium]
MEEKVKGKLVIIGGAEDKKRDCIILKKIIELSGNEKSRISIITAATENPIDIGKDYMDIFGSLGAGHVEFIDINTRTDANDRTKIARVRKSTTIFFTGGDQLRISSLLGGTSLINELHRAYKRGVIIAGTSAGASAMSDNMIISGPNDNSPQKCTIKMAPGLGIIKKVIIDQHFAQRGRVGRLLGAIAQNPDNIGVGIDEDTAVIVDDTAIFEVIGSQAVTVVDGRNISHTNVSELEPDQMLAITDITMHVLPSGYRFDLFNKMPIIGGEHESSRD